MKKILLLTLAAFMTVGCTLKEKLYTPSEAEAKLSAFCEKQSQLKVITRRVGGTLWAYAPLTEPIFGIKASEPETREKKIAPFSLLYIGGEFDGQKNFALNYDIVTDVLPGDPVSYGNSYNENYTKKRQVIYQGLQETIFNVKPADAPQFIVVMIADVNTGVATKSTIYLRDLKQYMTEALPPDEYYMRELNEVVGDKAMIGDNAGKFVKYADVQWTNFLLDQIKGRVKYKFTQSSFPPEADPDKMIAALAANTLRFYPYTDYKGIYLYNMRTKKDLSFTKQQLKAFEEESWWEGKGKLTTIRFDAGALSQPGENKKTAE